MSDLLNPTIEMLETDPEVKSYIYQQLAEFEPYVTPETVVAVIARDPRKLAVQLETEGKEISPKKLRGMFRIAIVLSEGEAKMQEEGLHENVFEAIRMAKQSLLTKLAEIQDSVISNGDRAAQINDAMSNNQLH